MLWKSLNYGVDIWVQKKEIAGLMGGLIRPKKMLKTLKGLGNKQKHARNKASRA